MVTQAGIGVEVDPGLPFEVVTIPDGERAKSLATDRGASAGSWPARTCTAATSSWPSAAASSPTWPASRPRATTAAPRSSTSRPRCSARSTRPSAGKTGVNLPEGKNLVGLVLAAASESSATPRRSRACPIASGGPATARWPSTPSWVSRISTGWTSVEQVARCVALKAEVVAADEREGGRRVILNYGHTLAHALEAAGLASEDASSAGVRASPRRGGRRSASCSQPSSPTSWAGSSSARVERHREVVAGYGLPVTLPPGADAAALVGFMTRDKKSDGGLTMVLDGPEGVEPVRGVALELVHEVLQEPRR